MSKQRGADVRTTTVPKGGPNRKSKMFEAYLMRNVPAPGEGFAGKTRTARIARFQARNFTPKARAHKRMRRRLTKAAHRANR